MTCHSCQIQCKRFGKHRNGLQRFRCNQCSKTYTEDHTRPERETRLPQERVVAVLQLLLEGMSVRSVERVTGIHRDTILRLLILAGERCQRLMDGKLKNLDVFVGGVDEIWGFVGKKESHKMKSEKQVEVLGDAYCFVGMERNCKLVLCHHLGKRDQLSTNIFMQKLAYSTSDQRFQLTSDGFKPYAHAVKNHLRKPVDFA